MNYVEWLNLNSNRSYPFKTDAGTMDRTNKVKLPNDFIIDAILSVSKNFQFDFYLSKYIYTPDLLSVTVSDAYTIEAMVGTIQNPSKDLANATMVMTGKDEYLGSWGKLVIGSVKNLMEGQYDYLTIFEPCRVMKSGRGISSINGIKDGNVVLASGSNVVIQVDGKKILLNTVDGICACENNPCIKTINDIPPLKNNFIFEGIGCVRFVPIENGLRAVNDCEDSCCGCDEINDMIDRIKILTDRIEILESHL